MTATVLDPTLLGTASSRTGFLAGLEGRSPLAFVGPNWFTPVMGTGIVANAAATLPVALPGLLLAARAVWVLDVLLLLVVLAATALHWRDHPVTARGHLDHPVLGHFYGAPAMALMTVGAGALLVGQPLVGTRAAVGLDAVLWTAGTLLGLWTAVTVPRRHARAGHYRPASASGAWLMPVVPPMVSAATGPLLLPHLPAGAWQVAMQAACLAMFGVALALSAVVVVALVGRLVRHGAGPAAGVPTLFIVLGPLGQSMTATHTLGGTAGVLAAPYRGVVEAAGLGYGLPVWGLATAWLALSVVVVARTVRAPGGLPFSLTWWSFTFPVGTVVTGTSGLAAATGWPAFVAVAVALYAVLVAAWVVVAVRTGGGMCRGDLLRDPRRGPRVVLLAGARS